MKNTKGILLISTGHPYYGRLSYNLCASIKAAEKFPVAVVYSGRALSHLSESQKTLFDNIIEMPEHIPEGFAPKLYLNELSPFTETLFLDADMLWAPGKKVSDLFAELSQTEYTGITEGFIDLATMDEATSNLGYHFWADATEIKDVYKLKDGKMYQWRSEVIYFKKGKLSDKLFKKAQAIYSDPKLSTIKKFGTQIPDELAINISAAINGIAPHKERWTPAYWHKLNKDQAVRSVNDWYLVSFGGNSSGGQIKKMYDNIAKSAFAKLGRQHVFSLQSKRDYLPERQKF